MPSVSWQCRRDERAEQAVDVRRPKRTSTLEPPVQYEDKGRRDVLHEQVSGDQLRGLRAGRGRSPELIAQQFRDDASKMLVQNDASLPAHPCFAGPPMLVVMLKDWQAKPGLSGRKHGLA